MPRPVILTIKDQVYQYLREIILNGDIKPGQRINEVEIAKELKISRSPVHSAISELVGEGLLESIPNKLVQVRQLTEKQVLDVLEFRMLIETFSIKKVIEDLNEETQQKLENFKTLFLNYSDYEYISDYIKTDERFHAFLVDRTGNEIIVESYHRYVSLINPFRFISLKSKKRFEDSIPEHIETIDAMIERNLDKAINVCCRHLKLASDQIVEYFKSLN